MISINKMYQIKRYEDFVLKLRKVYDDYSSPDEVSVFSNGNVFTITEINYGYTGYDGSDSFVIKTKENRTRFVYRTSEFIDFFEEVKNFTSEEFEI